MWISIVTILYIVRCAYSGDGVAKNLTYVQQLTGDTYDTFLKADQDVKVVYYFKHAGVPRLSKFIAELEKSAAIMKFYSAQFGLVDCGANGQTGHCMDADSENRVYMFRHGRQLLNVSLHSMFNTDSIISNVLQVVLLHEAPILQALPDRERFENENKGQHDLVFSYQNALGTFGHRMYMEVVYVHHNKYRFAVTNEYATVRDLPGFSESEDSAIWLLHCKSVRSFDEACPVVKYNGPMSRSALADFFSSLDQPTVNAVDAAGNRVVLQDNGLHTAFIYHDRDSHGIAVQTGRDLGQTFFGQLRVVMVDLAAIDGELFGFDPHWSIPTLAVRKASQKSYVRMNEEDVPERFIAEQLAILATDYVVTDSTPASSTARAMPSEEQSVAEQIKRNVTVNDESISITAFQLRRDVVDTTNIMILNDKTFFTKVKDIPMTVVLFYLPFDSKSQLTLRVYSKAADALKTENFPDCFTAVNCFDWTDVCQRVNVTSFPKILVYRDDTVEPEEYTGSLSISALTVAAKLYLVGGPREVSSEMELDVYLGNDNPADFAALTIVGVFNINQTDDTGLATFKMAARRLRGRAMTAVASDQFLDCQEYFQKPPPCVIVRKRYDPLQPYVVLSPDGSVDQLYDKSLEATVPMFAELRVAMFPRLLSLRKPFVIVFTNGTSTTLVPCMESVVGSLAVEIPKSEAAIFTWMDTSKPDRMALNILEHHVTQPNSEELLVIDPSKGTVHRFVDVSIDVETVRKWVLDVIRGHLPPTKALSTSDWKPRQAGFDFLNATDSEAERLTKGSILEQQLSKLDEEGMSDDEGDPSSELSVAMEDIESGIQEELSQLRSSRLVQEPQSAGRMHHEKLEAEEETGASRPGNLPPKHSEL